MKNYKIYPLPLIKLKGPKGVLTHLTDMAEQADSYASIWYIEGAQKPILIDAGGSAETMRKRGFEAEHIASPDEALSKIGLTSKDIGLIICTHLHNDHMELAQLYSNATFIIQKAELEANLHPHPVEAPRCVPQHQLEGINFNPIIGDKKIAPGLEVIFTPGHTRGGQSVIVHTQAGNVVVSGLCTVKENFHPAKNNQGRMGVIPPGIHLDLRQAYDSLIKIKAKADYLIIPLHEPAFALRPSIP